MTAFAVKVCTTSLWLAAGPVSASQMHSKRMMPQSQTSLLLMAGISPRLLKAEAFKLMLSGTYLLYCHIQNVKAELVENRS